MPVVSLDLIKCLSSLREAGESGAEAVASVLPQLAPRQDDIRVSIEQLKILRRDSGFARYLIQQCRNCPNRPNRIACPECPVDKNIDRSDIARLIWDPDCP